MNAEVRECEIGGQAVIGDRIAPKPIHRVNFGQRLDQARNLFRKRSGVLVAERFPGSDIQISLQLIVHPHGQGVTQATDHDPDADHHGRRDRHGCDDHRCALERLRQYVCP